MQHISGWASTNGPQETFGSLRHAAACFKLLVKGTIIFGKRHMFQKSRPKHSESRALTGGGQEFSTRLCTLGVLQAHGRRMCNRCAFQSTL